MVWVVVRVTDDGDGRFVACYRDPEGRQRSAGTFSTTQKYMHTHPDADAKNLTALDRIRGSDHGSPPEPAG